LFSASSSNYSRPASEVEIRDLEDSATLLASDQLWTAPITAGPRIQLFVSRDKVFTNVFGRLTTFNISEAFERPNDTILKGGDTKKLKIWGVSPDGKHLAAIKRGTLDRLWLINSMTGKPRFKWFYESGGHSGKATFSPDSRYLVAMNAYKKLRLWDLTTGKSIGSVRSVHRCYKISVSSNCLCLFLGFESGEIQVWDLQTLKPKFSILSSETRYEKRILQFAASTTEMKVAYVTAGGKVGIYDVEEKSLNEWAIPGLFLSDDDAGKIRYSNQPRDEHIAISDDGKFLSLLHHSSLYVWDTHTRQLLLRHQDYITAQVAGSDKLMTLTRHEDSNNATNWQLTMHSLGR
jgi:WD40 repeat protein